MHGIQAMPISRALRYPAASTAHPESAMANNWKQLRCEADYSLAQKDAQGALKAGMLGCKIELANADLLIFRLLSFLVPI
jgi:hypothetical protein